MDDVISSGVLSFSGAQRLVESVLSSAEARNLTVAVAVSGPSGDLRAFARMDGVSMLAGENARRKCKTAILTGRSTRDLGERFKGWLVDDPPLFHGMMQIDGIAPFPGGIPIRWKGNVIGAVGVSGASSEEDHELADQAASLVAD